MPVHGAAAEPLLPAQALASTAAQEGSRPPAKPDAPRAFGKLDSPGTEGKAGQTAAAVGRRTKVAFGRLRFLSAPGLRSPLALVLPRILLGSGQRMMLGSSGLARAARLGWAPAGPRRAAEGIRATPRLCLPLVLMLLAVPPRVDSSWW